MVPPTLMKSFTPAPVVVVFARSKFTVPPAMSALPLTVNVAGVGATANPSVTVPVLCRLPMRSVPAPFVRPAMKVLPLMLVKVAPEPAETSSDAPLRMVMAGLFEK